MTVPVGPLPPASVATSRTGPPSRVPDEARVEMVGVAFSITE